ncbi:MAG: CDGSH iron-sulfur domain-containing protein [Thermoanaerobaculia bacterium]
MSDERPQRRPKVHSYASDEIEVSWSAGRCIHAAECVRGLPEVFAPGERPWIHPRAGEADAIAEVVERCPTGALHYRRAEGSEERPDTENTIRLAADGPVYLRGALEVRTADGTVVEETRMALCRCGASANKPFCDGSHAESGFEAGTAIAEGAIDEGIEAGPLLLTVRPNGSIGLEGPYRALDSDGTVRVVRAKGSLCRCGASENKPWCDGSHKRIGFVAE